jgi:hypothetical protein
MVGLPFRACREVRGGPLTGSFAHLDSRHSAGMPKNASARVEIGIDRFIGVLVASDPAVREVEAADHSFGNLYIAWSGSGVQSRS